MPSMTEPISPPADKSPVQWLDDHGDVLYHYALRLTRDPVRAEDAVQDTLLAAWEARGRYAGKATVRTWLIGILKHKLMDQFRQQARDAMPEPILVEPSERDDDFDADGAWREPIADWGDPVVALEKVQFLRTLQQCVDRLPAAMAEIFRLNDVLEEDAEIICNKLAISATNLRTTLHRARLKLRRCLDRNWRDVTAP